jgi:hypothetical protein
MIATGAASPNVGARRTDTSYARPDALLTGSDDRPFIYLDLNHWIALAKAAVGHRDGHRHRDALDRLRAADAVFPLSAAHYMEMAGIKDPRQRHDVAAVMEELSGFVCLMPRTVVIRAEIDASIRRLVPDLKRLHEPIPILGLGVLQAFGRSGGLRVKSPEGDVTERVRRDWDGGPDAFDAWASGGERQLDRSVLCGPTDREAPDLEKLGWNPTYARRIAEERAQAERDHAKRLDGEPHWRRGRLRDIVSARYLTGDAEDALNEVMREHGIRLATVLTAPDLARSFTDSMPAGDVWISLVTAAHRNAQTIWTPNDIFDLDAMTIAVAYSDAVVTDRHARHMLSASGLPSRLDTEVFATLDELVDWL